MCRALSLYGFGVDFLVIDVCNDHQELFLSESASMATWTENFETWRCSLKVGNGSTSLWWGIIGTN
jgi:hypothetical protein